MNRGQPYASASAVIERALHQLGAKRAAAAMHVSLSQAYAYADAASGQLPQLDRLRALCAAGAQAPAEDLAALAGGVYLPLPPDSGDGISSGAAAVALEAGQAMATICHALEDGRLTAAEIDAALRELDQLIRAAAWLRQRLLARRDGGPACKGLACKGVAP